MRFKHSSDCPKLSQGGYGATVLSKDIHESDSQTAQQQVCERTQETRNLTELEGMDSMNDNTQPDEGQIGGKRTPLISNWKLSIF